MMPNHLSLEREKVNKYNLEAVSKLIYILPLGFQLEISKCERHGNTISFFCLRDTLEKGFSINFYEFCSLEDTKKAWNYVFKKISNPDNLVGHYSTHSFSEITI